MFEIDTGLIFWTILSFLILVYLLYKLVFPPLQKILKERRQAIEGRLEQAKRAQAEAEDLLKKYQLQLADSERKSVEMFEDARRRSESIRDEAIKKAHREAVQIIENSKKDIDVFKRKALVGLKDDITAIMVDVSQKLIKKKLSVKDHLKLVESSIKELDRSAKRKV